LTGDPPGFVACKSVHRRPPALLVPEVYVSKHAAAMCVELENLTVKFAENGGADPYDLNIFHRVYNTLRRGCETLNIHRGRIPRDIAPAPTLAASIAPQHDPRYSGDWAAARAKDDARRAVNEARWAKEEEARQAESRREYEPSLRR
jgi:hypothetical protein